MKYSIKVKEQRKSERNSSNGKELFITTYVKKINKATVTNQYSNNNP